MSTNQEREWIDADKLRDEADRMEEGARNAEKPGAVEWSHGYAEAMRECAKHLRALLPNPQPRNLEEMTRDEREACQWMQADFDGEMVLLTKVSPDRVAFLHRSGTPGVYSSSWFHRITPLPDLRRMEWPEEQE